jgi:predicted HAD superfamily hydrolase
MDYMHNNSYWYNLGYDIFGNIVAAFFEWIVNRAVKDGVEKIYFISREGLVLEKLFEQYLSLHPEHKKLSHQHLFASRRSYNVASLYSLDKKEIDGISRLTYSITVRDFIFRLGLNAEDYKSEVVQYGFESLDDYIDLGAGIKRIKRFIRDFKSDILDEAEIEREGVLLYLKKQGITSLSKIAVVDVGWHGTIQNSIARMLQNEELNVKTFGYYLCTFPDSEAYIQNKVRMKGYLCNQGKPKRVFELFKSCLELFEFAFTANDNSVEKFENIKGNLKMSFNKDLDLDIYKTQLVFAEELQAGVLDFLKNNLNRSEESMSVSMGKIAAILDNPKEEDLSKIGSLFHIDNYAGSPQILFFTRSPKVFSNNRLLNLVREYNRALWKKGFLKRANVFERVFLTFLIKLNILKT